MSDHFTPKEVAAHLKTSSTQVLRWTRAGVIPTTVRVGKIYRYNIKAVEAALSERSKRGGER